MYVIAANDLNAPFAETLEARNLRGAIDDLGLIVDNNLKMKQLIEEKDAGKPGHYYGRDMMIEGSMPMAAFLMAKFEYGGDDDWYKDDRKFQDYMKRNPIYNWLRR